MLFELISDLEGTFSNQITMRSFLQGNKNVSNGIGKIGKLLCPKVCVINLVEIYIDYACGKYLDPWLGTSHNLCEFSKSYKLITSLRVIIIQEHQISDSILPIPIDQSFSVAKTSYSSLDSFL